MAKWSYTPDVSDKVILIVGGSRGIGAASVRGFLEQGAKVVVTARRQNLLDDFAATFPAGSAIRTIAADMSDPQAMENAVDLAVSSFGRLDCAFNCAGGAHPPARIHAMPREDFLATMDWNVTGLFAALQPQVWAMLEKGGGSIINMASGAGIVAIANLPAYVAAKHAVVGLSKAVALDYAADNIRCNVIAPGPILTDAILEAGFSDKQFQTWAAAPPMKRHAEPGEVVGTVLWLASDSSSFVTGVTIPVDGGYVVR